jgi:hypothetical protein
VDETLCTGLGSLGVSDVERYERVWGPYLAESEAPPWDQLRGFSLNLGDVPPIFG